jgi:hypothetical protein
MGKNNVGNTDLFSSLTSRKQVSSNTLAPVVASGSGAASRVVVVLGCFSEHFPQQRFVTTRVQDIRRYIRHGLLPVPSAAPIDVHNGTGTDTGIDTNRAHSSSSSSISKSSSMSQDGEDDKMEEESEQHCAGDDFDMCNERVNILMIIKSNRPYKHVLFLYFLV